MLTLNELTLTKVQQEPDNCNVWRIQHVHILRVLALLRDHHDFYFKQLTDITAVDYVQRAEGRFDVVYHLLSHRYNQRARVMCTVAENEEISSVVDLFECANWYEREVWDLFGIPFRNHPDLRRILTDYGFEGHPLRKDFPLSGHIQVRFDEREQRIVREPVCLEQPYRDFDHTNPWRGEHTVLW